MPFWLSAILAFVGMAIFADYWEAVILLLISDALHGAIEVKFINFTLISSSSALFILIVFHFLKKKLRFYSEY